MSTICGQVEFTVNLMLFRQNELYDDNTLKVSDERFTHLQQVLRVSEGDAVRVGQINGQLGTGTIAELSEKDAVLIITLAQEPIKKLPLKVILALPRPKMLRRIIRTIAEMGIEELHLINSSRVEKSYWQTPVLAQDVLEHYSLQGLSQARDTVLPRIAQHRRFKPFVEDELPAILENRRALLAHPGPVPLCPADEEIDSVLIIGPEGGFIPYEVEKLLGAGALQVNLGDRILRVDTAIPTLVGRFLRSTRSIEAPVSG
ncbi:MAG: 16S rRNA (uracil(1498)-N(3))-methyltransferase [Halioglobus sp.]